ELQASCEGSARFRFGKGRSQGRTASLAKEQHRIPCLVRKAEAHQEVACRQTAVRRAARNARFPVAAARWQRRLADHAGAQAAVKTAQEGKNRATPGKEPSGRGKRPPRRQAGGEACRGS